MKQKIKLILFLICTLSIWQVKSQILNLPKDTNQIAFCNASPVAVRTNSNTALFKSLPPTIPAGSYIICGNGKFRLIFQDIINSTGAGFNDATLGATRRNCVCDVINYIESVISIPSNIGTTDPTIDIIFNQSTNTGTGALASAIPIFPASFYTTPVPTPTPGYYGGYLYDYITTGIKPDINSEEAQVSVNFGYNYSYCQSTIGDCEYDFFSIMLHEMTHGLGFISFAIDNSGVLSSRFGNNVFSKFEQNFLYFNNGTGFDKLVDISLYSANNGINPALPLNAATSNSIWLKNTILSNKQNQPVNSQSVYNAGTSLSHLDTRYDRCYMSPGYSPNHLMNGSIATHQFKREYTLQEVSILQTMGYTIKSSFSGLGNINNHTPYHTGEMISTFAGFNNGYMNITPASGLSDLTISTTNGNPVTLNLTTGIVTNGSTSQSLNFIDADSDPITVYEPLPGWKGLYNIRGCGNGGNNTNQLNINATRDIITFTPRNNFIGRAQFAFHLYDGKQRGDYVVFTIDVSRGSAFVNTPSNELVINGNFEEGTEVREQGANEFNLVAEETSVTYNYAGGKAIPDGAEYVTSGWNDPFIRNSSKDCLFYNWCFDNCSSMGGYSGPLPTTNLGNRYVLFASFSGFKES